MNITHKTTLSVYHSLKKVIGESKVDVVIRIPTIFASFWNEPLGSDSKVDQFHQWKQHKIQVQKLQYCTHLHIVNVNPELYEYDFSSTFT
jgi:hypothetical protein